MVSWMHPEKKAVSRLNSDALVTQLPSSSQNMEFSRKEINMTKKYDEKEIRADYRRLTKLLIEKKLTITTMESATSGQIASLITDTEGSSAVLKGAFVTYCNEAKIMQGVPAEIIDKYTVYSTQTAEAMAKGFV